MPREISSEKVQDILRNIPVWDGELLNAVYEQLQQLRTYYDFTTVDVSHLKVNDRNQQVFLAARELNLNEMPTGARNWPNDHLLYTHGYGVVMTPAGQGGDEPMTWFIRGIPLESDVGFNIEQPAIYFGLLDDYNFVIAPNEDREFGYPSGDANMMTDYQGSGGVPIDSLFRKLIFSAYFQDHNILFTTKTKPDSRILFRRNIQERINLLTPYLLLDNDPYVAATSKGIYWIQDAYTVSDRFPNAAMTQTEEARFNYIRNSVKIVVDAYNGSVNYYIFAPEDPIIQAYSRIYPGLFKDGSELPPDLRHQARYPQDIFDIQIGIYSKYHQTEPDVFYQQEDVWEFAAMPLRGQTIPIKSYYLTLDMIERGESGFILLAPMSPQGRSNLRSLVLVGCDDPHYGKFVVYSFPKGELVYGPSQIYSLINQDTQVSQQFTLWDQAGSEIDRGKMIIFPIGQMITYIQPVYLTSSTAQKIPELKRLIMTQGQVVIMEASLEEAFEKLHARLTEEAERVERRYRLPATGTGTAPRDTPALPDTGAVPPGPPRQPPEPPKPAPEPPKPAPEPSPSPEAAEPLPKPADTPPEPAEPTLDPMEAVKPEQGGE
jgi:hypothetical protein